VLTLVTAWYGEDNEYYKNTSAVDREVYMNFNGVVKAASAILTGGSPAAGKVLAAGSTAGDATWTSYAATGITAGQISAWDAVGTIVVRETPTGVTGVTGAYDLQHLVKDSSEEVYLNGQLQEPNNEDYDTSIEAGITRITFVPGALEGTPKVRVSYRW
jgi:hypothetical protein